MHSHQQRLACHQRNGDEVPLRVVRGAHEEGRVDRDLRSQREQQRVSVGSRRSHLRTPMTPSPPGRLSTITGTPKSLVRPSARMRADVSCPPAPRRSRVVCPARGSLPPQRSSKRPTRSRTQPAAQPPARRAVRVVSSCRTRHSGSSRSTESILPSRLRLGAARTDGSGDDHRKRVNHTGTQVPVHERCLQGPMPWARRARTPCSDRTAPQVAHDALG